jgi:hypothetical protein
MKKVWLLAGVFFLVITVNGQTNTFPSSGSVGIGTTTPGEKFHVTGGRIYANGTGTGSGFTLNTWSMYQTSADVFNIRYNLSDVLTANTNGNVGIGTVSPYGKLNISNAGAEGLEFGPGYNSNASRLLSYNRSAGVYNKLALDASGFEFQINDVAKMTMAANGSVGIGTNAPDEKLQVTGGRIYANGTGIASGFTLNTWSMYQTNADVFNLRYNLSDVLTAGTNGNVGIGAASPDHKLAVNGTMAVLGGSRFSLWNPLTNEYSYAETDASNNLILSTAAAEKMRITSGGNIGIGTPTPAEKLSVNGNIIAKKIRITQTGWSDYVFNDDYKLRDLGMVEAFIKQNKHLPEVPSTKEVEAEGISLGDNQALLLKKIEELTLYIIEMKKEMGGMQAQISSLKKNRK